MLTCFLRSCLLRVESRVIYRSIEKEDTGYHFGASRSVYVMRLNQEVLRSGLLAGRAKDDKGGWHQFRI